MAPMPMAALPLPSLPSTKAKAQASPGKPLLRRPTLTGSTIRTRDEAGLDLDTSAPSAPPSPSKRARTVTFSPVVEEQAFASSATMAGFALESAQDLAVVRVEVRIALEEHLKGASEEAYDVVKEVFVPDRKAAESEMERPSNEMMKLHLLALTSFVSLLGRNCAGLVKAILGCEWVGRDEGFVKVYVQFLGNLASAQGSYVMAVLDMLVDKFARVRNSSGRLPDCPIVGRQQMIARVHMALKYILRLIPSASGTLSPSLRKKFPFLEDSKKDHMNFIDSLLRIIEYAPELKSDILMLITERLVKIDVQMQVDFDDLNDEVAAAIVQAISLQPNRLPAEDDDADDDSDADSVASDESLEGDAARIKEVQGNVEKMDAILDILFSIYTPYFNDPHSIIAHNMFDTLLTHFRNIILPTYRSRHTQFLLFHFAQKSEHLVDTFAGECVELAFKSGRPAVLKQSAAAYLASFVARGAHVPPHVVRDVFDYIGTCIDTIREENEQTCRGPDLQRYGTFYATTQALLYIFCFRWRDLVVSSSSPDLLDDDDSAALLGHDLEWRPGVKDLLSRTIYSKLNPLKICAPPIVKEFAKIANRLSFIYVYPLLEANKRVRLSQFALGVSGSGGIIREAAFRTGLKTEGEEESWHQLDAYFPFDPYQLPVSKRWVEDDYVVWKGIPGGMEDEDEDEDEGSTDGEDGGVELEDGDVDTATEDDDDA